MKENEAMDVLNMIEAHGPLPTEAKKLAIKALEKQKKIKDLLDSCTAYPDDMCDCLVEIEKILRSDEE